MNPLQTVRSSQNEVQWIKNTEIIFKKLINKAQMAIEERDLLKIELEFTKKQLAVYKADLATVKEFTAGK